MAEKLAIAGGKPVVDTKSIKRWPIITQEDRDAVLGVLDRGIVAGSTAPEAVGLEKDWAAYCGSKYCLTTNSGTAALHMALAAAGIGPGDEVITHTPSLDQLKDTIASIIKGDKPIVKAVCLPNG